MRPGSAPIWTISRGSSALGATLKTVCERRSKTKNEPSAGLTAERQLGEASGDVRGKAADRSERGLSSPPRS